MAKSITISRNLNLAGQIQAKYIRIFPEVLTVDGYYIFGIGVNNYGRIGIGTTPTVAYDLTAISTDKIVDMALGNNGGLACGTDGRIYTWGYNGYGQCGTGDTSVQYTPYVVPGITDVIKVCAGGYGGSSYYAITSSGQLWVCGRNDHGQLGLGDTTDRHQFSLVTGISFADIAAGEFHAIGKSAGAEGLLYVWGYNSAGELGLGDYVMRSSPTLHVPQRFASKIACWYRGSAYLFDGVVYTTGRNTEGELGIGSSTPGYRNTFGAISTTTVFTDISSFYYHVMALDDEGHIWGWGNNGQNQIYDYGVYTPNIYSPVLSSSDREYSHIDAGYFHSLALSDGYIYAAGYNDYNCFGGTPYGSGNFRPITDDSGGWNDISAGVYCSIFSNVNQIL